MLKPDAQTETEAISKNSQLLDCSAIKNHMLFRRLLSYLIGLTVGLTLTVAQAQTAKVDLKVDAINSSLQSPWGLAFLPDGRMLVTERTGALKLLAASGQTQGTLGGVPQVNSAGQGGLLDVVIDPAFDTNQRIYLSYSENDAANPSLSGTAVARARLDLVANQRKGAAKSRFRKAAFVAVLAGSMDLAAASDAATIRRSDCSCAWADEPAHPSDRHKGHAH